MSDPRRALPSVHWLVEQAATAGLANGIPPAALTDAVRETLAAARDQSGAEPPEGWLGAVRSALERQQMLHVRPVINATGVVLHTNLGRAPLARPARHAVENALGYATVEYELDDGSRGSRQTGVDRLFRSLTGAEAAFVTNNAAAALLLALHALADDRETLVSRGELVEIGGSFRLPEIFAKSGSLLIEVGTTNRTRLEDYALAVSPRTRAILKVHRSNFRMTGFVSEVAITDLVALGTARGIEAIHDVGSGLLVSLEDYGLRGEPLVRDSVASGATVVFSGDKLLGGPQAGIILGRAGVIEAVQSNPLARALRPDKLTLAGLEATLQLYRDPEVARQEIPVLAMLTADPDVLAARARFLAAQIPGATTVDGHSAVGGGAFPEAPLHTTLVSVPLATAETAVAALRHHEPPIIARVERDHLLLDPRTLAEDELPVVSAAVAALRSPSPKRAH